jgi:hypothetical protein
VFSFASRAALFLASRSALSRMVRPALAAALFTALVALFTAPLTSGGLTDGGGGAAEIGAMDIPHVGHALAGSAMRMPAKTASTAPYERK